MCKATTTPTIAELAKQIMARADVYAAAGGDLSDWRGYLEYRLIEAGIEPTKEAVLALSQAITAIWLPETPKWDLATIMKATKAEDARAIKAVAKLLDTAKLTGQAVTYTQDGHTWTITEVKAGTRSGTPLARLHTGAWFCFASAEGFAIASRPAAPGVAKLQTV